MLSIRILLVNSQYKDYQFSSETSAQEICNYIYDNWPKEWPEKPDQNILRLIYQGRFFMDDTTLESMNISPGTTVIHLVMRENVPKPAKQENMQNLKVREEIYEQFLAFKSKVRPNLSNDDFIQFLMNRFENCCSKVNCNGIYSNGVRETSEINSYQVKDESNIEFSSATMQYSLEKQTNSSSSSTNLYQENTPNQISASKFVCPECKYMSSSQHEIENHFDDCHDLSGTFPCTCNQCFNSMSQFLAHYIICPIAATDLQQNNFNDDEIVEGESIQEEEMEPSDPVFETRSPLTHSTEQTPIQNEDSDDLPLDYANPINLVKNEIKDPSVTNYSITSINVDYFSNSEKNCLPTSINMSSPTSQDQPKRTGKIYECEHCEKNFKSKGLLDQHKHLHFPPRHECEYCGRRFRWPPQFYTHKQQCSKRKVSFNDSQDSNNVKKSTFNYSTISSTYNHTESLISQSPKVFTHHQIPEQCLCGFKTNNMPEMYEHKRACIASARAMILQKIIDYKSMQNQSLIPNMQSVNGGGITSPSVHSVIQNYIPNSTNAPTLSNFPVLSNTDNIGLSQHTLPIGTVTPTQTTTVHEEKPFECDFCESRFMTKISLKQHLDGKHSDQAKYCCEKCGKGYFWNASYNYHKKKCMIKPLAVINLNN